MEAHLLRTLSDCGEPSGLGSGELERPGRESWQVMVRRASVGVDQLRVSSPDSDSSKDGRLKLGSWEECLRAHMTISQHYTLYTHVCVYMRTCSYVYVRA